MRNGGGVMNGGGVREGGGVKEAVLSRSQELLDMGHFREGHVRETRSQEMDDTWSPEISRKAFRGVASQEGCGRGVASQEMDYSQESQYSLPPKLERVRVQSMSKPHSHSQPDDYRPFPHKDHALGLVPAPKGFHSKRRVTMGLIEDQRKSIGGVADLIKVENYYDTLSRKKNATSAGSTPSLANPRTMDVGVAVGVAGAREEHRPITSNLLDSSHKGGPSHSGGSVSTGGPSHSGGSASGGVTRPSCLKSSSLVTTASTTSSTSTTALEVQGLTTPGNAGGLKTSPPRNSGGLKIFPTATPGNSGGLKISPLHNSHVVSGRDCAQDRKRITSIPRSTKVGPSSSQSPVLTTDSWGAEKSTITSSNNTKKVKKPHLNRLPSRYRPGVKVQVRGQGTGQQGLEYRKGSK